jgi:hypothetical protein
MCPHQIKRTAGFLLITVAGALSASAANTTYYVNLTIGVGSVTGDIVTDGKIGVLAQADILDWNLVLNDGSATFDLLGPLSGSNSSILQFAASDFSATATQLLFDFNGTDAGGVTFADSSHDYEFCLTADTPTCANQTASAEEITFVSPPPSPSTTTQVTSPMGIQLIASVASARPITYTLSGNLTGTLGKLTLIKAPFAWTIIADTTGVTEVASQRYQNAATFSQISIGNSAATVTDSVSAYVDQRNQLGSGFVSLSNTAGTSTITLTDPMDVEPWLLATPLGPIAGSDTYLSTSPLNTTQGQLSITSVSNLVFQASAPATVGPYTFTTLNVPTSPAAGAFGINNSGQVVGESVGAVPDDGFLLSGGTLTAVAPAGSTAASASGINSQGQVVGWYQAGNVESGFLLSSGAYSNINYPGAALTAAYGINGSGQVVGFFENQAPGTQSGFLLSGGVYSSINYPGAIDTSLIGINNSGQIVGTSVVPGAINGFLLSDGNYNLLSVPGTLTALTGINDIGQVAGGYSNGGVASGFVLSGGNVTSVNYPGAASTEVYGINDSGQIVGFYTTSANPGQRYSFLATPSPFFAGSVNGGFGTQYLQFPHGNIFGYYGLLGSGWMYHVDLGYEYVSPGSGPDVYLWDLASGHWWYTDTSSFPYLYDFNLNTWIYYFPNTTSPGQYTTSPRYFSNLTTAQIFTM